MKNRILSVDPGKSTGWAIFDLSQRLPLQKGISRSVDQFVELLSDLSTASSLYAVVVEDFLLRPYTNQSGSRMEAPQIIGALRLYAKQQCVEIHLQPSSILPIAKRWCPEHPMPKGNHKYSHDISAVHHGTYWLVKNGHVPTPRTGSLLPGEKL